MSDGTKDRKISKVSTKSIAVIVAVVLIAGVVGTVVYEHSKSSSAVIGPKNRNQLIVVETEPPNSIDPASGFYAGEDEIMTNVYQGLVMFNDSNSSSIVPILAQSWSHNTNYSVWDFSLRKSVTFENGLGYNASSAWFNFYRTILMNQAGAFYFLNLLYNGTTSASTGYNVPSGLINDFEANGYSNLTTQNTTSQSSSAAHILAQILSNFNPSNKTIRNITQFPNQAVVVTGNYSLQFNLLHTYEPFDTVLAVPGAGQVEPSYVDKHGGVLPNSQNVYMNTHSMGTAPYYIESYVQGESVTMQENPNYWAKNLSENQTNIMLSTPHIPTVIIEYTTSANTLVSDLESNYASLVEGPPIPALTPSAVQTLSKVAGVKVVDLSNAPKFEFLMAALDNAKYPYNVTNFRLALAHALNYSQIVSSDLGNLGTPYVGPISPGLEYYNPSNLAPYSYEPNLSIKLLTNLGIKLSLPNGTTINPNGKTLSLSISYVTSSVTQLKAAQEMQAMFKLVGLTFQINPLTVQAEESVISQPGNASSYPGLLLWDWYPSWLDPVYQDLVVQLNTYYGGISGDVSWFDNSTVNNITNQLPFVINSTEKMKLVQEVYNITYSQAPDLWIYAKNTYWAQRDYLQGVIYNPGILGYYYPLMYYSS